MNTLTKNFFGISTSRIQKMRESILSTNPMVCAERAILTTEAYKEHADKQIPLKRAYALEKILNNMSIYIEDETLIVGNQASRNRAAPVFPEYAIDFIINELDEYSTRDGDRFDISEKTKDNLRSIADFWHKNTLKDKGLAAMPKSSKLFYDLGIIKAEGNITSGDGHLAVKYDEVLKLGLLGIKEHVVGKRAMLDLTDFSSLKKSYFYEAILIVIDASINFAKRYADKAKELSEITKDENRKKELIEIERICRTVPANPAKTLHEAVQSVWFIHLILQIESNGHSVSYGRLDQYLYPYFIKDKNDGIITDEDASELLENLWLKTFTINKVRSASHTKFSAGSPLYQNVTVGGQTIDGHDAVNRLSEIVLQSVARLKLPQPNLTVRYHKNLNNDFMTKCFEVIKLGFGMPAFNNDEIIIPSFISRGIKKEDAYNYSAIGCVEVAVPGKWGYRCTGMSFLNFPKTLLIALNNGVDVKTGARVTEGLGHFTEMKSFDDVIKAWDTIVREFTRHSVIIDSSADLVLEQEVPDILCSALVDDCIERGLHLKEGGAVYDFISGLQVGIANLADSLSAIKKCVFEDKSITTKELWESLLNNFEGKDGAKIKAILDNAPKYGNDDDYVDTLLTKAYDSYIDEIAKYKNTRFGRGPIGGTYYAGTSSISANVPQGAGTTATPDGRLAGAPLAEGCSPSHSADTNGPTAVFKSVAKLPTDKITGGVLLNQKVTPQMLEKEGNKDKFIMLVRAFFDTLKGFHVQYNVVAKETMIEAQQNPEKHRDLVVRVAGYSAFFNVLSKQTQDDIIERTEQVL